MKLHILTIALASLAFASGCEVKKQNNSENANTQFSSPQGWPDYVDQNLSGKVYGESWAATTAVALQSLSNSNELTVNIYSEPLTNACSSNVINKKPKATVIIPTDYTTTEYAMDLDSMSVKSGNPLTFIWNTV